MTKDKLDRLAEVVMNAPSNALRSKQNRKRFCGDLVYHVGLWEPQAQSFIEEMIGLNFFNPEDRLLFIQFADCAF